MRHRGQRSPKERSARSALIKLMTKRRPMLQGSPVTMKRRCGKENCRCARGHKHVSLYLATRLEGKRKMICVPKELEEKVRRWIDDGQEARGLFEAVCQASLEALLREKQALHSNREGRTK